MYCSSFGTDLNEDFFQLESILKTECGKKVYFSRCKLRLVDHQVQNQIAKVG